jgi:phenylalanyl-tRNA synthetase alpha chain
VFSVTLDDFKQRHAQLQEEVEAQLSSVTASEHVGALRDRLTGRHSGLLRELQTMIPALPPAERAEAGKLFNALQEHVRERLLALKVVVAAEPVVDTTMPPRNPWRGSVHPVSLVIDEIIDIFRELGFTIALGPEAESEWYNFGALNFPPDHPAMELHDTLYLEGGGLLRTHTSPVQIRTLQSYPPPIRVLAPGNVYRRDFFDSTHAPAFAQLEGLAVDEDVSFADLKATLNHFARRFFGSSRRTRFGPSYFPFTEPSAQMDVEVDLGDGKGLRWVEILGCGLVHPAVLESCGVDSEKYSGWAFGMGPGRIALSRHGIPDIRILYDSDVRFLAQFAR